MEESMPNVYLELYKILKKLRKALQRYARC